MMDGEAFRQYAELVALFLLGISFLLTVVRVIIGPTLPDRVLGLDVLVVTAIGFIAVVGIKTGFTLFLDIAIALGLVGFLATVAFARFIMNQGRHHAQENEEPTNGESEAQG